MSVKTTEATRRYALQRVQAEFAMAEQRLSDALIPIRMEIEAKLNDELGITKMEEMIKELEAEQGRVDQEFETRIQTLTAQVAKVKPTQYGRALANSPFTRAVDDQLAQAPESTRLNELKAARVKAQDGLMLAGATDEIKLALSEVAKVINTLLPEHKSTLLLSE